MSSLENDVPKHRKKKESSTSKSKVKSKHKHKYMDCLLIVSEKKRPHKATYCKICGKIGDVSFFDTVHCENGYRRMLDIDEVFEKYKDLEQFNIDDIWQKYVAIRKGE